MKAVHSTTARPRIPDRPRDSYGHNIWSGDFIERCSDRFVLNCLRGLATAIEQDPDSVHLYCGRVRRIVDILKQRTALSIPPEAPARKESITMK